MLLPLSLSCILKHTKESNYLVLPRTSNFIKYQSSYASYSLILNFINDAESITKILGVKYKFGVHVLIQNNKMSFISL